MRTSETHHVPQNYSASAAELPFENVEILSVNTNIDRDYPSDDLGSAVQTTDSKKLFHNDSLDLIMIKHITKEAHEASVRFFGPRAGIYITTSLRNEPFKAIAPGGHYTIPANSYLIACKFSPAQAIEAVINSVSAA